MNKINVNNNKNITAKEPWYVANLSFFFPGVGQIYSGNKLKGLIFIISKILLSLWMLWIVIFPEKHLLRDGLIWLLLYVFVGNWNLIDAYLSTKISNPPAFESNRKSKKDPWFAVLLSRIIPGIGHIYIGSYFVGIILIIISLAAYLIPVGHAILFLVLPFSIYHVYINSPERREKSKKKITGIVLATVLLPIFVWIPSIFFITNIVAEAQWIKSNAMQPTLNGNQNQWDADNFIVDKFSYKFHKPERGDIIVFSPTETLKKEEYTDNFVKRIIGLPGEKVELKDGKVYINDKHLLEDSYVEQNQSTLVDVCISGSQPVFISQPIIVSENSYFVLGDDRNISYDSRCWGLVPKNNIIGKVSKIFFPIARVRSL